MINSEKLFVKETAKAPLDRENEHQGHLDSKLAMKLTALDVETDDRIKSIDSSVKEVKENEALYLTAVIRRQPGGGKTTHGGQLSHRN